VWAPIFQQESSSPSGASRPRGGHEICWDYDGFDMVPPNRKNLYARLFDSRLPPLLNERRLLVRGRPVEGLLRGNAFQPIPDSVDLCKPVAATLNLTDDAGRTVTLRIRLTVDRSLAPKQTRLAPRRKGSLLDKRDPIVSGWSDRETRPVPAPTANCDSETMDQAFLNHINKVLSLNPGCVEKVPKDRS